MRAVTIPRFGDAAVLTGRLHVELRDRLPWPGPTAGSSPATAPASWCSPSTPSGEVAQPAWASTARARSVRAAVISSTDRPRCWRWYWYSSGARGPAAGRPGRRAAPRPGRGRPRRAGPGRGPARSRRRRWRTAAGRSPPPGPGARGRPATGPWPRRRRPGARPAGRPGPAAAAPQQLLLERPLVLVEQGHRDRRPVRVAAVQGPLADPGGAGDLLHGHPVPAVAGEQPLGGLQDTPAVVRDRAAARLAGRRPGRPAPPARTPAHPRPPGWSHLLLAGVALIQLT